MAKILIVEDDPLIIRMYQRVFKFEKYEVETADNGRDALDLLATFRPTIILLDVMMPQMDGLAVLEEIKKNPATKNIPVIVLTNLAGTDDVERALELGAVKYIVKSDHKPKEIVDIVKSILAAYTRNEVPGS